MRSQSRPSATISFRRSCGTLPTGLRLEDCRGCCHFGCTFTEHAASLHVPFRAVYKARLSGGSGLAVRASVQHRNQRPVATRFQPRHELLRVAAPVHDLDDLTWLRPAGHAEMLEAVAMFRGVLPALRALARRHALAALIEPVGRGQVASTLSVRCQRQLVAIPWWAEPQRPVMN